MKKLTQKLIMFLYDFVKSFGAFGATYVHYIKLNEVNNTF